MSKWYKIVLVIALAVMATAAFWLVREAPSGVDWSAAGVGEHQEWFRVDWYEQPVGEAQLKMLRLPSGQFMITEIVSISGKAQSRQLDMKHTQQLIFAAKPPHNLESGSLQIDETDRRVSTSFTNGPELMSIVGGGNGITAQSAATYNLDDFLAARRWLTQSPEKGAVQRLRHFDFKTLTVSTQDVAVLETPETTDHWLLSFRSHGKSWHSLVKYNRLGMPLHFTMGSGMELTWQPSRPATAIERSDFYQQNIVTLDQTIGEAKSVESVSLVFDPAEAHWFSDQPGLVVSGGNQLRTAVHEHTEALNAEKDYLSLDIGDKYNQPRIERMTRVMMSDAANEVEKVERLLNFVHHYIEHQPVMSELGVDDILTLRKGDCTEYALLFLTMARTAGIPAREINGLVYLGDDLQGFGGHTWVEVAIGGQWQAVDPTWNLFEITGTHIRLGEGEEGAVALMQARRDLKFELSDVEYLN